MPCLFLYGTSLLTSITKPRPKRFSKSFDSHKTQDATVVIYVSEASIERMVTL